MISRVERTRFAEWWWTVDRMMLAAIAVLMMTGIVLSLAASPAVATRIGLDAFYFVNRHAMYQIDQNKSDSRTRCCSENCAPCESLRSRLMPFL